MNDSIAVLIRHAEYHQLTNTPSAWQPFGLTAAGFAQAVQGADAITTFAVKNNLPLCPQIDCSSLLRAWQTAEHIRCQLLDGPLSEKNDLHLASFDALAERSVGSVANLSSTQIEELARQDPRFDALPPNWKSASEFKLPFAGAESLMQAGQRVARHLLQSMQALSSSGQACIKLFVGHGAAFRHAAYHLGILEKKQIVRLSMFHAHPVFFRYHQNKPWQHLAGDWKIRHAGEQHKD